MAPDGSSVGQILRQAETLKTTLRCSKVDFSVGSEGWTSRQILQDLYKDILLTDLEYALDKKVEQDLWNSVFKGHIDHLRQLAKEQKGSKRNEVQAVLSLFLEASSGFYIQLLQELCLVYSLDIPGHTRSSLLGILDEMQERGGFKKPHTQSCNYICQDCLVHLGDIARYCDDTNQAELFYRHALTLVPANGQPYNQLAILASSKGDQMGTVYFYCRSIAVKNQFPAATTNLHKIFSKICSTHNTSAQCTGTISKAEFFHLFLQFHGSIYLVQDLDHTRVLKERIVNEMKGIIKCDVLSSDNLVHLLSICLFTLYHVRSSAGDDLEEFECIGKDEEECWQLTLGLTVDLFSTFVKLCLEFTGDINECAALPAVCVLCQWIQSNSSTLWHEEALKRVGLWSDFAMLLNRLQAAQAAERSDVPLREDWELQCFLPLRAYQKKLNFNTKRMVRDREYVVRANRIVTFGCRLVNFVPRILEKYEDPSSGEIMFSLKRHYSPSTEEYSVPEEKFPKSFQDIDLESAGQKLLVSLPNLQISTQSATPFSQTSSLFKSSTDEPTQRSSREPFAQSSVAQYSLFQSGWNAPLTSAAFGNAASRTSASSPSSSIPSPDPFTTPVNSSPIGPGPGSGPGEGFAANSLAPGFPNQTSAANIPSSSSGSFGGLGIGGSWGSGGVWAPVSSAAPTPPPNLQAIWNSSFGPSPPPQGAECLSPLQQLLQEQKKDQRKDT